MRLLAETTGHGFERGPYTPAMPDRAPGDRRGNRLPGVADFDEIATSFWDDDFPGVQPPLTDAMVQDAEHVLGVVLPVTLLACDWNAF
jgi:hypothetical protein